jgi:cell division protein FtsL
MMIIIYSFIIFIFIILCLFVLKPSYIYDNNKKKFKKFGMTNNKTLLPIYLIAIILPVIIYLLLKNYNNYNNNNNNYNNNNYINYSNNNRILQLQSELNSLINRK